MSDLVARLEAILEHEESVFRAQLLREDIARLQRLERLRREAPDLESFNRAGRRVGWTQGDARTEELREPLDRLLELLYREAHGGADAALAADIEAAWATLHRIRMERLVGCLATPVPKPER